MINFRFPGYQRARDRMFAYRLDPPLRWGHRLDLTGLGLKERMSPCFNYRPQGNRDYLFLCFHTPLELTVGSQSHAMTKGSFILLEPRQAHEYGHSSRNWTHSWLHCSGSLVTTLIRDLALPLNHPVGLNVASEFESWLGLIHEEVVNRAPADEATLAALMEVGLRRLARVLQQPSQEPSIPAPLRELKLQLDVQYRLPWTLKQCAAKLGYSTAYACQQFKDAFDQSPIDYLIDVRIKHAQRLLSDTNLAIGSVAGEVGYEDVFYFSKLFKRRAGQSPRAYRLDQTR